MRDSPPIHVGENDDANEIRRRKSWWAVWE
jgi:hypothetical protein